MCFRWLIFINDHTKIVFLHWYPAEGNQKCLSSKKLNVRSIFIYPKLLHGSTDMNWINIKGSRRNHMAKRRKDMISSCSSFIQLNPMILCLCCVVESYNILSLKRIKKSRLNYTCLIKFTQKKKCENTEWNHDHWSKLLSLVQFLSDFIHTTINRILPR